LRLWEVLRVERGRHERRCNTTVERVASTPKSVNVRKEETRENEPSRQDKKEENIGGKGHKWRNCPDWNVNSFPLLSVR